MNRLQELPRWTIGEPLQAPFESLAPKDHVVVVSTLPRSIGRHEKDVSNFEGVLHIDPVSEPSKNPERHTGGVQVDHFACSASVGHALH